MAIRETKTLIKHGEKELLIVNQRHSYAWPHCFLTEAEVLYTEGFIARIVWLAMLPLSTVLFRIPDSIMAAAGGPVLGATNPTLNNDDFCLYNYMSDDELMQLAIERSLAETHNNAPSAENTKSSGPQRRTEIPRPSQHQTPRPAPEPTPCPANPPR